jgi:phosphinothricin acetyltransferase
MVAIIGDSANVASIALHRRAGFRPTGTLTAVGWKHGRWIDSVIMQRDLGSGALSSPEPISPQPVSTYP